LTRTNFGILGGGFGAYGWIPAAALFSEAGIFTLLRYRAVIESRQELKHLAGRVQFVDDVNELLSNADTLVVARRPQDQLDVVRHLVDRGWRGRLVLEKPLAPDPAQAESLLDAVSTTGIRLGSGFTMHRTKWATDLTACLTGRPQVVHIQWKFLAHHYRHDLSNWKRIYAQGGGAIRFFGIHLIDFLAQIGDWDIFECSRRASGDEDPAVTFSASDGATKVYVHCDTQWRGAPEFSVEARCGNAVLLSRSLADPFDGDPETGAPHKDGDDRRIPYLFGVLREVVEKGGEQPSHLRKHVSLWKKLEAQRSRPDQFISDK